MAEFTLIYNAFQSSVNVQTAWCKELYMTADPWSTYDISKVDVHPIITINKMTIVCLTILQLNQLTTNITGN